MLGSYGLEKLKYGGFAVWRSCSVWELWSCVWVSCLSEGVTFLGNCIVGSCNVGDLHCGRVAIWGSCSVGELQCGEVVVWWESQCGEVMVLGSCDVG